MATTLDMLLAALNREGLPPVPAPAPSMPLPVRTAGPTPGPPLSAPPELPPVAPLPAADTNFVNQYAGPAPVAPVQRDPGLLDKLSTILLGVSSGLQGRAPQFIESVREERLRPIREYNAALERFQNRRTQGLEIDTRRREREQDRATRTAEAKAEREFQQFVSDRQFMNQAARDQAQQAFQLELQTRRADAELRELQRKERGQQERDARLIARDFGKVGAKPEIARELGRYYSMLTDEISPEAAKFESAQARLAEVRARRAAAGGAGGGAATSVRAQKMIDEINSINQKMAEAEARGDQQTVKQLMLRSKAAIRNAARFPGIEAGFDPSGKWPYAKPRGQVQAPAQAAAPQGQNNDPLGIR